MFVLAFCGKGVTSIDDATSETCLGKVSIGNQDICQKHGGQGVLAALRYELRRGDETDGSAVLRTTLASMSPLYRKLAAMHDVSVPSNVAQKR